MHGGQHVRSARMSLSEKDQTEADPDSSQPVRQISEDYFGVRAT